MPDPNAMLPCFKCGKTLPTAIPDEANQPQGGTVFHTYGHYGSTFWDDGYEALVLNVCDDCLRANTTRLARRRPQREVITHDLRPYGEEQAHA